MTWQAGKRRDPLLITKQHKANRQYWVRARQPCARCGGPIAYDEPAFFTINGRRVLNLKALHVGHKVSRRQAKALGWTDAQINALSNTQPEHAACSIRAGAREGRQARAQPKTRATDADRW